MSDYYPMFPDRIKELINKGIIDEVLAQSMVNTMIESIFQSALAENKIWKGKGTDTRWKFKKKDGKIVAKTTEDAIKMAYYEYWKESGKKEKLTYSQLFKNWLEYKHEVVGTEKGQLSPSTYKHYVNDYNKYISGTKLDNTQIGEITPIDIENFFKDMVKNNQVTKRCFNNIAGYIKSTFEYAYKRGYIPNNPYPLADLKRLRAFCVENNKTDAERILTTEEMQMLLIALHNAESKSELYMPNYAIELAMITGMRIGELAALKWECVKNDGIHIDYSEHRLDYEDKSSEYIIGEPKNGKHRVFPMVKKARALFKKIKALQKKNNIVNEFVFADSQGRYSESKIGLAMKRRCENAKIKNKSIHSIRRTVSSNLRKILPAATVANMMGHLESTNDTYYNYDTLTMDYKIEVISNLWDETYENGTDKTA